MGPLYRDGPSFGTAPRRVSQGMVRCARHLCAWGTAGGGTGTGGTETGGTGRRRRNPMFGLSGADADGLDGDPVALIVGVESAVQDAWARWLAALGWRVRTAATRAEVAVGDRPGLVLADAALWLASGAQDRPTDGLDPVLVLVQDAPDADDLRAAMGVGASDVIPLGTSRVELNALLERLADRIAGQQAHVLGRRALDQLASPVVIVGADDRVVFANAGAARISGWAASALVGTDAEDLVPELLSTGQAVHELMWADGSRVQVVGEWVHEGAMRVFVGRVPSVAGSAAAHGFVVSERMFLDTLEIAHDLNNKVQVLSLNLSTLGDVGPQGTPSVEDAKRLLTEAGRALAETVAITSRMRESGHQLVPRRSEVLDLVQLVQESVTHARIDAPDPSVVRFTPGEPQWVRVPHRRMLHAILHVLRNALHAVAGSPQGVVEVRVERAGDRVMVRIEDNGMGVGFGDETAVFSAWTSLSGAPGAMGLGLGISRKIANEAGGDLTLDTSAASGAAFVLVLPRLPSADG